MPHVFEVNADGVEIVAKERPHIQDQDWWVIEGAFRSGEIDALITSLKEIVFFTSAEHEEGPRGPVSGDWQHGMVAFLPDHHWASIKMASIVKTVAWMVERCRLPYWRCLQLAYYTRGMYLAEHVDASLAGYNHRLWTGVCELQGATDGGLVITGQTVHLNAGDVAVFRSTTPYRVETPTKGVRVHMTQWMSSNRRFAED